MNKKITEHFRMAITLLLKRVGNQATIAQKIGLTPQGISNIMGGRGNPTLQNVYDLCHTYGVNASWLFTGHGGILQDPSKEKELLDADPVHRALREAREGWQESSETNKVLTDTNKELAITNRTLAEANSSLVETSKMLAEAHSMLIKANEEITRLQIENAKAQRGAKADIQAKSKTQ